MSKYVAGGSGAGSDTVIAKASPWTVRVLLVPVVAGPIAALLVFPNWLITIPLFVLLVSLGVVADRRAGAMRLVVGNGGVDVVNFLSSHTFDLDTVVVETEEQPSHWPGEDIPASQLDSSQSGDAPKIGSLHLSDGAGRRVRVGVVPSYGRRLGVIVEDLNIAIAKHRLG